VGIAQLRREIGQLSADERLLLVESVWDDLSVDPEGIAVLEPHTAIVRDRLAEHDAAPDDIISRDELKREPA
jgi:putative addiction module component (TIGR02574 family)